MPQGACTLVLFCASTGWGVIEQAGEEGRNTGAAQERISSR